VKQKKKKFKAHFKIISKKKKKKEVKCLVIFKLLSIFTFLLNKIVFKTMFRVIVSANSALKTERSVFNALDYVVAKNNVEAIRQTFSSCYVETLMIPGE
jgi:hypothetical protein